MLAPAIAFMALGLLLMYFIRPGDNASWMLIVFGTLMMIGYMVVASVYNALIRDYTPKDKVGLFQGIRMIFQVALPYVHRSIYRQRYYFYKSYLCRRIQFVLFIIQIQKCF